MSDTPRTDAELLESRHGTYHVVPSEFARALERELAQLYDDAQTMGLVRKFGLSIDPQQDVPPFTWRVVCSLNGDWEHQIYAEGSDLNRAIVECVAQLQAKTDD
jgi:hypothetical protein